MKTMDSGDYVLLILATLLIIVIALSATGCAPPRDGIDGARGKDGQSITGPKGDTGASPTLTVTPAPTTVCPTGGQQINANGVLTFVCNGKNGTNATPIAVVQFCPGTTVYPTEFNEVGLLIDGKIYGVYSINNGALVYLPPGYYHSNVVNSSCNFTINANNTISH